jgi:OmpA-OmpF porin, OOP family
MTGPPIRSIVVTLLALTSLCVALRGQSADAAAMIAEVVRTGSVIVRGVEFDPGQAAATVGSQRSLAEIYAVLTEHDEWSFEVQVHTDESGNAAQDRALTDARAEWLVAWLTARGIAPARLVAKGYGSAKPLRSAPAVDPGLQHRRVELRKLNEE